MRCFIAFTACLAFATAAQAGEIEGAARAGDGDNIEFSVRLFGIDAPEFEQTCKDAAGVEYACGQVAADALAAMVKDKRVRCAVKDHDRYGRPVAVCRADEIDLGASLVEQGFAVAFRKYSDKYVPHEERAKAAGRGLWAGAFEMPRDYRARIRREGRRPVADDCPPPPADPEGEACLIKGNISNSGRIYHMPGTRDYDNVVIRPGKGQRYFCTEQEAMACGWRRPGR